MPDLHEKRDARRPVSHCGIHGGLSEWDLLLFFNEMTNYSVYQGAVGWAHAQWNGDFYPEDLPEAWQLSFYNTQCRCVYLPYAFWRNATDEAVSSWLQDTREGFRFVLQVPENIDEEARRLAGRFGARAVLEGQIDLLWLEGTPDLRDLAQRMQKAAQSGVPLFLIVRNGASGTLRQVGELMEILGV